MQQQLEQYVNLVLPYYNNLIEPELQKVYTIVKPYLYDLYYMTRPFVRLVEERINSLVGKYNLSAFELIVAYTITLYLALYLIKKISNFLYYFLGLDDPRPLSMKLFQFAVKKVPFAKQKYERDLAKTKKEFVLDMTRHFENQVSELPEKKETDQKKLETQIKKWAERDEKYSNTGKISGTRYCLPNHEKNVKEFCKEFIYHNPLHVSEFPASRQMEAEVISMTCKLFNNSESTGFITSGGTESILMGVLAHRNKAKTERGVTKPNIILPVTAHVAFNKACGYYNVETKIIPVDKDMRVNLKEVAKAIDKNTIALVGSCPQFPHGSVDDIPALGKLALKHKIGLHVDCCLGSFVVPFAKKLGANIPDFDFSVPGVTSISCDHHKYGMAPKGVSIIMFKNRELMHYSYFSYSLWPGGYYATSSPAGSRCAAPVVGAWYTMRMMGKEGYIEQAKKVLTAINYLRENIPKIDELQLLGDPQTCAIAFAFRPHIKKNIYAVEVALKERGWVLAAVQKPAGVHISVTLPFSENHKLFLEDLKWAVKEVITNQEKYVKGGKGAVGLYGASSQIKDTECMSDVLNMVVDTFFTLAPNKV